MAERRAQQEGKVRERVRKKKTIWEEMEQRKVMVEGRVEATRRS